MASAEAQAEKAVNNLERQRAALVDAYVTSAWKLWMSLSPDDWWNDAITQGAAAELANRHMLFVERMRRLGVQYADIMLHMVGADVSDMQLPSYEVVRDNTDPWKVALRPSETYRDYSAKEPGYRPKAWEGLEGDMRKAVDRWLELSKRRLAELTETDSGLVLRKVTLDRYRGSGVTRYRRIIHPELSRTGTCGLCVAAAGRVYSVKELMPLHARCNCTTLPIKAGNDPGLKLTDDDLVRLYAEAGGTKRGQLMGTRVLTVDNGEIGPVLSASEIKPRKTVPWHTPGEDMTRAQMERMLARAKVFNEAYQRVKDTGNSVSFRYEEASYLFKPSKHLEQSLAFMLKFARQLNARLGLAA